MGIFRIEIGFCWYVKGIKIDCCVGFVVCLDFNES